MMDLFSGKEGIKKKIWGTIVPVQWLSLEYEEGSPFTRVRDVT